MAQIGQFTRTPSGYSGRLRTLSLDVELTFTPSENADADKAPAYRIHLGDEYGPEVGAGWKHSGERAGPFVGPVVRCPDTAGVDEAVVRVAPAVGAEEERDRCLGDARG